MVNYKNVLLSANRTLRTPLSIIYPRDGAVTADYPLLLTNPARRADYDKLTALLLGKAEQAYFAGSMRRPTDAAVPLGKGMRADGAVDLPFPARLDAVDALLTAYLDKLRRPVRSWFVLDRSGSMDGERISNLKAAMRSLIESDPRSLSGRYARLADREKTIILTFDDMVDPPRTYTIDRGDAGGRHALLAAIEAIQADGNTAIYQAVAEALRAAVVEQPRAPDRVYSIVLMTDGENDAGMDIDAFARFYQGLPPQKAAIHVFPILFGEGDAGEMKRLAELTGGRTFDARGGDLATVFRDIRGYR